MKILLDLYLEKNLGDDLFLVSVLQRYPHHDFFVFSQLDYSKVENDYPNLKIIKRNRYWNALIHKSGSHINALKSFVNRTKIDALVVIGGSIFMEYPDWEKLYKERLKLWSHFKEKNKPVYIIGTNFGPYQSEKFIDSYRKAFDLVEDICFREEYSYQLFNENPNVRKEADAVFSMDIVGTKSSIETKSIAISIIDLLSRPKLKEYNQVYIEQIRNWIRAFQSDGYRVTLLSFCQSEGDELQIKRILELETISGAETLFYDGDINHFLSEFGKFEKVVATRFHSIVLSLLYKKELFALNYSKKSENLISDNHLVTEMRRIEDMEELSYEQLFTQFKKEDKVSDLKDSANRQFKALDTFLERN